MPSQGVRSLARRCPEDSAGRLYAIPLEEVLRRELAPIEGGYYS